jgi:hypothetical protein
MRKPVDTSQLMKFGGECKKWTNGKGENEEQS